LYHGVIPLLLEFTDDAETTIDAAIAQLVARGYLSKTQVVALVQSGKRPIWRSASTHTIQVRVRFRTKSNCT
jgi:pyruvate kinase